MEGYNKKIGNIGEKIAKQYLKRHKYKILEINYYAKVGEIDIIAQKDITIIFVEVKTRTNLKYGTPAMAINQNKKRHIKMSAQYYVLKNNYKKFNIRFDVIEVFIKDGKCNINHIQNAF